MISRPFSRRLWPLQAVMLRASCPTQPAGIERGNWIQTDPKKGWFTILRLYSPLEPFFAKTWRPSEVELVR